MRSNDPRDHHCVPKFFLRNFAIDEEKNRITTVAKNADRAIWGNRAIDSVGVEEYFYVHYDRGVPISVEADINRRIETPISQSDTWQKIASGRTDELDQRDRGILYALIRHLHVRTPHYQNTIAELAAMAERSDNAVSFTEEEREMYATLRAHPEFAKGFLNLMAAAPGWTERNFKGSLIAMYRSPISLRSSTTPVHAIAAPAHHAMDLTLPGTTSHQLLLTLNPTTFASLVIGDFDGAFSNRTITVDEARGFNRHYVAQFAFFDGVRHLIAGRDELVEDLCWAGYELISEAGRKIVFRRRRR